MRVEVADADAGAMRCGHGGSATRVVGVDVARGLALIGMAATHIFPDYRGDEVHPAYVVAAGRASALFAVLAGVSLSLVAARSDSLARFRVATVVRAVLLLALGWRSARSTRRRW